MFIAESRIHQHRTRVLLCGTQYGQVYLPAIFEAPELELAGIFAKGSHRSVRLAEQWNVPLYSSPEQLHQNRATFDIACIALNQAIATPLAASLLEQHTPVLVEHPLNTINLKMLMAASEASETDCHINSHFAELPPASQFIALCQQLNQTETPLFVQLFCNTRTLFSLLDILQRCFGSLNLSGFEILKTANSSNPYTLAKMNVQNFECVLNYQNWRGELDNGHDSPLGHHMLIGYAAGTLTLGGTFGPTLWAPLIAAGAPAAAPVYSGSNAPPDVAQVIEWRKRANQKALLALCRHPQEPAQNSGNFQNASTLTELCIVWTDLTAQLGDYQVKPVKPVLSPSMWHASSIMDATSRNPR